jgi:hypothetical protein
VAGEENGLWSKFLVKRAVAEQSLTEYFDSVLNAELSHMEFRQLHSAAPTLIATLRRSFAQKTNGHIGNTATKMWEVLSSSVFDEVDEDKMVKIVRGEALVGGMKRMGY